MGGVLQGQELIKRSKVNSVISDFKKFNLAANTFYLKYTQLPGDFRNATTTWPTATTANGDNNREIDADGNLFAAEGARFWQHLSLAQLIEGGYLGRSQEAGDSPGGVIGEDAPRSKMAANAGYGIVYTSTAYLKSAVDIKYGVPSGNAIRLGALDGATSGLYENGAILNHDAHDIDVKMDDGLPMTGRVFSYLQNGFIDLTNNAYLLSDDSNLIDLSYELR